MAADWAALPPLVTLKVFAHCATPKDAAAWRLTCKSFLAVCGRVDMLQLRVVGEDKAAAAALDASLRDIATWFGLDLDFVPFELVQQGRITSPFVLRPEQAKLVESVMQHLHKGIRWARLAEPASFSLPYHLHKLSRCVSLELVLNPAMEEVVFHSAALAGLQHLRRLTLQGRLPAHRRRMQRRALPRLSPSVTHLTAHGLNLADTDWSHARRLHSLDLSHCDVRLGPYCGALLASLRELVMRGAALELSTPAVFADMASLRCLDLEGCTAARTGSWLSRVLGATPDMLALPPGLTQLRAMSSNVFDKCALELGACTALQRLELSSGAQLPATLKHAPAGVPLGLHIAEEAQVVTRQGRDSVSVKACLAGRLADIRRLGGCGLGRAALGVLGEMPGLRRLCLLAGERRRLDLELALPELEMLRIEGYQIAKLRLPVCLRLHTAVLSGHGVCAQLALPPSLRVLVLDSVMRDARTLSLATMVPRLRTAVLGMGLLPASLPATVERLGVVGEPSEPALSLAYSGLQALLPQLPHLKELRFTSGQALPDALAALLPPGCTFSTAGLPREGPATDCWGRSLHQTAPLHMDWCESLLTTAGLNLDAIEAGPDAALMRQISRVVTS